MKKPTVEDIARHADVSTATVGRVLNNRGSVSANAREKVANAVRELGYRQLPDSITHSVRGVLKFLFLIPNGESAFLQMFKQAVASAPAAVPDYEVKIDFGYIPFDDDEAIIAQLDAVSCEDYQGIAVFAVDAPGVRHAIERAKTRGLQVVTLVSDITDAPVNFIGINNVNAGRVAGSLMGRFLPAGRHKIAIVCGTARLRDQIDRIYGFNQALGATLKTVEVLEPLEGNSIIEKNYQLVRKLLAEHPDISGIYSSSAGNSGILRALSEIEQRPIVIMHELTPRLREALSRGELDAVIGQNVDHIARSAVRVLRAHCLEAPIVESQEKITIDIFLADNMP
ncbi:LacI family DNA-binding transcriptional regulator [Marinovum algicola]|jgi:LacI family transcriptional regulator|uniref:LacI family DNA-binding transcriptional regulator n=1 Tax=Marinovum algicola TaxID=42444 RepID=UPI0024BBC613|nr:LacI family DNA-binding transcriptional regulator [Marinovum algicola]